MCFFVMQGSLPSNVGGAANVRNILRRTFALLENKGWWKLMGGLDGFLELFEHHKKDLSAIYGAFKPYKVSRGTTVQLHVAAAVFVAHACCVGVLSAYRPVIPSDHRA